MVILLSVPCWIISLPHVPVTTPALWYEIGIRGMQGNVEFASKGDEEAVTGRLTCTQHPTVTELPSARLCVRALEHSTAEAAAS